jgi:hypothetical protein
MPTGYEVQMYRNVERIARALERIASVMEKQEFGISSAEIAQVRDMIVDPRKWCDECQEMHEPPVSERGVDGPSCPRTEVVKAQK